MNERKNETQPVLHLNDWNGSDTQLGLQKQMGENCQAASQAKATDLTGSAAGPGAPAAGRWRPDQCAQQ